MPTHNKLTYERFAAGADELVAAGTKPSRLTYRMLREKVGGSFTTIEGFLNTYRQSHPEVEVDRSIPPDLHAALRAALARQRVEVEQAFAEQLSFEKRLNSELHDGLLSAEERLERLDEELQRRTTERDSSLGQCTEVQAQVHALKEELTDALQRAEDVSRDALVAQSQLDVAKGSDKEFREQAEARLSSLRKELTCVTGQLKEANGQTKEAEVKLAEVRAHLEAEREAKAALKDQLSQTIASLQRHHAESVKAAVDAAEVESLRAQLSVVERGNNTLQKLLQSLDAVKLQHDVPVDGRREEAGR